MTTTTPEEDGREPKPAPPSISPTGGPPVESGQAPPAAPPHGPAPVVLQATARAPRRSRAARTQYVWRALAEVGIVTLGVLLAFALNAWWMDRSERRQEEAHLRALISDVEWNLGALREFIERQEQVAQAASELLQIAANDPDAPGERVQGLVGRVFSSSRFEPVTGAYDALVNSAGLTLVGDTTLRASLATFAARLEDRYAERFADALYLSLIQEFAGQVRFSDQVLDRPASESFSPLLRNPRFRDFLALREAGERDVAGQYRRIATAADTILAQLRAELQ